MLILSSLIQRLKEKRVPHLLQLHAMRCEREGAFSAALAAFSAAAEGLALQMEAEEDSCCDVACNPSNGGAAANEHCEEIKQDNFEHKKQQQMIECLHGKARCALKAGELQKGLQLAADLDDCGVYRECADILLNIQQYRHAAILLKRAGDIERAASVYIQVHTYRCKHEHPSVCLLIQSNITYNICTYICHIRNSTHPYPYIY